jgi:transcriptional regulator with XRE-family HTH domain
MSHQKKQPRFDNVVDLVRDSVSDDPNLADELSDQISKRQLVRRLANLRNIKGISQDEIAEHLDCRQPRISKLENGLDSDVSMADLQAYAKALDCELGIVFRSRKLTIVDEVKRHAVCIKHCFDKLNKLAEQDEKVAKGVADFHVEALLNLVKIVKDSVTDLNGVRGNGEEIHISLQLQESATDDHPSESEGQSLLADDSRKRGHVLA